MFARNSVLISLMFVISGPLMAADRDHSSPDRSPAYYREKSETHQELNRVYQAVIQDTRKQMDPLRPQSMDSQLAQESAASNKSHYFALTTPASREPASAPRAAMPWATNVGGATFSLK